MPSVPKPKKRKKTELQRATEKADELCSAWVCRDGFCMVCGKTTSDLTKKGKKVALGWSHYQGRAHWNTRYDPDNLDCFCNGCHMIWEHEKQNAYRDYMIEKLGGAFQLDELRRKSEILVGQRNAVYAALEWLIPWSKGGGNGNIY